MMSMHTHIRSTLRVVLSRCEYTFEKNLPSDNRGFAKFVSHSELRHPQLNLLPSDTLTILCEISISGESVVTSGTSKSVSHFVRFRR